jgi:hypothetical protein
LAKPVLPDPVKLLVAVLWANAAQLRQALVVLSKTWGGLDFAGPDHDFAATRYYEPEMGPEMGPELKRRLVAFARLVPSESLAGAKITCNELEDRLAEGGSRRVNLDVGYLDHNKIVLASAKTAGQKIHMGGGIFADLVARYRDGRYQPFEWTFPDFRDGRYDAELRQIRRQYLAQLRDIRRSGGLA